MIIMRYNPFVNEQIRGSAILEFKLTPRCGEYGISKRCRKYFKSISKRFLILKKGLLPLYGWGTENFLEKPLMSAPPSLGVCSQAMIRCLGPDDLLPILFVSTRNHHLLLHVFVFAIIL